MAILGNFKSYQKQIVHWVNFNESRMLYDKAFSAKNVLRQNLMEETKL